MRFKKSEGLTASEALLAELCERSFLQLWTYPNLFKKPGKELIDLMVVFGDDILLFSDKSCAYPQTGNPALVPLKARENVIVLQNRTDSNKPVLLVGA